MTRAGTALERLAEEIRTHRGCGFEPCETCTNPVPGEGPASAEVMLVGEAPGRQEDETGRPFVGPAGRFLDRLLGERGLARDDVFITNVLKARPPKNRARSQPRSRTAGRGSTGRSSSSTRCSWWPSAGTRSGSSCPGRKITQTRGQVRLANGREVYPAPHPSAALRTEATRHQLQDDFAALAGALRRAGADRRQELDAFGGRVGQLQRVGDGQRRNVAPTMRVARGAAASPSTKPPATHRPTQYGHTTSSPTARRRPCRGRPPRPRRGPPPPGSG